MKKVLVLFLAILFVSPLGAAEPYGKLNVAYRYDKDYYYRFIFTDVDEVKAGNFDEVFEEAGLNKATMSTLYNGRLINDSRLYVAWVADDANNPIDRLNLYIPGPLVHSPECELDWYASVGTLGTVGGKGGYGEANSITVYDRTVDLKEDGSHSLLLNLWTEDVTGKTAGNYFGSLVLKVYGEM